MIITTFSPWMYRVKRDALNSLHIPDRVWTPFVTGSSITPTEWTFKHGTTESTFDGWGIQNPRIQAQSQDGSSFTFTVEVSDIKAGHNFVEGTAVEVWKGRKTENRIFCDGRLFWQGYVDTCRKIGGAKSRAVEVVCSCVWRHKLKAHTYQADWVVYNVTTQQFERRKSSHLFIGIMWNSQTQQFVALKTDEMIHNILDYCATNGSPIAHPGPYPSTPFLFFEVKDAMGAELIMRLLRWNPDASLWLDHSTKPPTLHCKKRSEQTAITLEYGTPPLSEVDLNPRNDLKVPAVVIRYETQTENASGQSVIVHTEELSGDPGTTGTEPRALVQTISLTGQQSQRAKLFCMTEEIYPSSKIWWAVRQPWLSHPFIDWNSVQILQWEAKTLAGGTLDIVALPFELRRGNLAPWMKSGPSTYVQAAQGYIRAKIRYKIYDNIAKPTDFQEHEKVVTWNLTACDIITPVNGQWFETITSLTTGEATPENLAASLYAALSQTHYSGSVVIIDQDCGDWLDEAGISDGVGIGHTLNITGGAAEWAAMNAQIQTVDMDLTNGTTTLGIGPPSHLTADDIVEWLRENRRRIITTNPMAQSSGVLGDAGNTITMGDHASDASAALGVDRFRRLTVATDNKRFFDVDATVDDKITMSFGRDDNGDDIMQLVDTEALGHQVRFRKIDACRINEDGTVTNGFRIVSCSDFFEEEEEEE